MHHIIRDKGKFFIINDYSLGHFYKNNFLTNIGCSLGHFYKKRFLTTFKKKFTFFFTENINFNEKEIKKVTFTKTKKAFQIDDIDINKMLV